MTPPLRTFVLLVLLSSWSCRGEQHQAGAGGHGTGEHPGPAAEEERPGIALTRWTERTELFVEFPALVVGLPSTFAAHLTRLDDFRPVEEGRVVVLLAGGEYAEERFEIAEPDVPGIFRPVVRPRSAGAHRVRLVLESAGLRDEHDLGEVVVHRDQRAARAAAGPDEGAGGAIRFLKEQQWRMSFATAAVGERVLRPSHAVYGTLRARADGEVRLTAPVGGRLLTTGTAFPRIGSEVAPEQVLVSIAAPPAAADVATLELAVQQGRLALEYAEREHARLAELLAAGVIPERRVVDAEHARARAAVELVAARRRLEQHRRVQPKPGDGSVGGIEVRAPLAGTIVDVSVVAGVFVEPGQELLHLIDLERLWLEARVPETDLGRVDGARGAWFEIEGYEGAFAAAGERLVATGGMVDADSRTAALVFEVDNPDRRLRVGLAARVHLPTGEPISAVAIPGSALLDDRGQEVAFVQVEGEAFERRLVQTGLRDGGWVEVLAGLRPGEHVVVRGAFAVKLAASTTALPAHGHAH